MSNQLKNKAMTLAQILEQNRLTKEAADQKIQHTSPDALNNLGAEQQKEIKDGVEGVLASTPEAEIKDTKEVPSLPQTQNLNTPADAKLSQTGSKIEVMKQDGTPTSLPKTAAEYKTRLASIIGDMKKKAAEDAEAAEAAKQAEAQNKTASSQYKEKLAAAFAAMKKQAAETKPANPVDHPDFRTGTEVMNKIASLDDKSTEDDIKSVEQEIIKLASHNPLFVECRDRILMRKVAEDIAALAANEGISEEEAAAALDEAAAQYPEMASDLEDEANGEAVAELAGAEQEAAALDEGIAQLAAGASEALGTEITPDDIVAAADETARQAEAMGVPPEALIEAAMQELQGAGAEDDVAPEDLEAAQQILDEAAAQGISPDEVIQMAAAELNGGAPAEEEAPVEEAPAEPEEKKPEEDVQKTASVKPAHTLRSGFVSHLRHQK